MRRMLIVDALAVTFGRTDAKADADCRQRQMVRYRLGKRYKDPERLWRRDFKRPMVRF